MGTIPLSRRGFLYQAAKTLAIAAGVAALPTSTAAAAVPGEQSRRRFDASSDAGPDNQIPVRCCADARACGGGCSSGKVKFYCSSSCGHYCTSCQSANPNCYTFYLPAC